MKKIKLLLIEDNRLLREGILNLLAGHDEFEVIASSGDNKSSYTKIRQLTPDVVLLDLGLRNQNSLRIVEILKEEFPTAKIIIMDLAPVQADIKLYLKAGANGFILKDATLNDFLVTIRTVAEGENVLPPHVVDSLFSKIIDLAIRDGKLKLNEAVIMTKREKEVMALLSEGMSNKEIAHKIHISAHTVKSHVHNIMEKLALHTRLEVANYSYTEEALLSITNSISVIPN
ncbi:MAG: response regulator transcription factor [Ignavibacteria bacterium]|nr:response regulator transcription factor [Ignavibacteria bacterium]